MATHQEGMKWLLLPQRGFWGRRGWARGSKERRPAWGLYCRQGWAQVGVPVLEERLVWFETPAVTKLGASEFISLPRCGEEGELTSTSCQQSDTKSCHLES